MGLNLRANLSPEEMMSLISAQLPNPYFTGRSGSIPLPIFDNSGNLQSFREIPFPFFDAQPRPKMRGKLEERLQVARDMRL